MSGRRPEVPDDRLATARQQREANHLVDGPSPDVGGGHVPDVGEVEAKDGAQLRPLEFGLETSKPLVTQPGHVDPLLPVDIVRPEGSNSHGQPPTSRA